MKVLALSIVRRLVIACWMASNLGTAHGADTKRIELAERAVLSDRNWTSESVSVAGFFLGETRAQVVDSAHRAGYGAICDDGAATRSPNSCAITLNKQSSYEGLNVDFGPDDVVNGIRIDWNYFFCADNGCFARRLKGPIGELLTNYSDHDRLSLLGPATRERRADTKKGENVQYFYDERGLTLAVQRKMTVAIADRGNALVTLFLGPVKP
jgi:hypothetical protein